MFKKIYAGLEIFFIACDNDKIKFSSIWLIFNFTNKTVG